MKTALKWILRIVLGIIVLILLFIAGTFATLSIQSKQKEKAAEEKITGPVRHLTLDGYTFRDLNKNGNLDPYEDSRTSVSDRVEDLIFRMTIEEKAGMMLHPFLPEVDSSQDVPGSKLIRLFVSPKDVILNREIRHVTSLLGPDDPVIHVRWHNMIQNLAEQSRLGIPITVSSDPRHSERVGATVTMNAFSRWPDPLGFGAIGDSMTVVEFGRMAAREYRAVGIQTGLHPMADLATEPRWARISGTFGEDAFLSARLTAAYINGWQGDSLSPTSVTCMTKHFPGGGPQEGGWDAHFKYGMNQAYPGNNFEHHLIPFRAAIAAGTAQMMPYYGVPVGQTSEDVGFAFNQEVITGLLKEEMGYQGVVCTDWFVISPYKFLGITFFQGMDHGVEHLECIEKTEKALNAGIDQFGGEYNPQHIIDLVKKGRIPESRIDESVRKLLRIKFQLGLFDNPYVDEDEAREICNNEHFRAAGKEAMLRSMVLLTNGGKDGFRLPLQKSAKVYVMDVDPEVAGQYADVTDNVQDADVVLMHLKAPYELRRGINDGIFHQGSLEFPPGELESISGIMESKPTVVAIYLERPSVIPEIAENAAAVVGHFGATDEVLLELVFGLAQPTGKLPFEMASSMALVTKQKEDVPFDSGDPLFPFGHGLTYE